MNLHILNTEVQNFINQHINDDLAKLILKGSPFKEVSIQEIAQQIVGKQKSEKKLPTWYKNSKIIFPAKLNLEQTSSEITAKYKSELTKGKSIIDLTGGFGIDCFYFAQSFEKVTHCEINAELSTIVQHNFKELSCINIDFFVGDCLDHLANNRKHYDCIYADPSRRNEKKGKVFLLEDCLPDIPNQLDQLWNYTDTILLKYAPMLDIQKGIESLQFPKEVHVVAINNEVKELLFLLKKGFKENITIKTINFSKENKQLFEFKKDDVVDVSYSEPLQYLYEPNSAILKSGGFNQVANQFRLKKLHPHSHLYTSNDEIDFPGRMFLVEAIFPFNKKQLRNLGISKANITTRNFPLSVDEIRKKTNIKSGGEIYLFFTTNHQNQLLIIKTKKVS